MSTHFDKQGHPHMVDVSHKEKNLRRACASGKLRCNAEAFTHGLHGTGKKGNVLQAAELAGIMGAKHTAMLIPLCHNVPLHALNVRISTQDLEDGGGCFTVWAEAITKAETGVEMEALNAASIACLTLYDMLKAYDKAMVIEQIQLEEKQGGKSGDFKRGQN